MFNCNQNIGIGITVGTCQGGSGVAPPPELWLPTDGNAYMWFDLNDADSVTFDETTKAVSQIDDKTGNFIGLKQTAVNKQPTYNEADGSIMMNGDDVLSLNTTCDLTQSNMYLNIHKLSDISVACNLFATSKNFNRNNAGLNRQTFLSTTKNGTISKVADTYAGESILYDHTAETGEMRTDAVYDVDIAGTNTVIEKALFVFNNASAVDFTMKESIWYNFYDPSVMEITEGYVFWNNGLESLLPAGHKYKTAPPYKHYLLDINGNVLTDGTGKKLYTVEAGV